MSVDFYESQKSPDEQAQELANDLLKVEQDLLSKVDLIKKYNPDLTNKQAEEIYRKNKLINTTTGSITMSVR